MLSERIMTQENSVVDTRLHVRLKRHFLKHRKRIKNHFQKHHKKYLFGSVSYGIAHILILKVLALKLLAFKVLVGLFAVLGIENHMMTDTLAKIDNICIKNVPIVATQLCERNFASVQEAVGYIESQVDPETDTLYTATHYGLLSSVLREYCGRK